MVHMTSRALVIEGGHIRAPKPDEHFVHLVDGRWVCVLGEHAGMACHLGLAA